MQITAEGVKKMDYSKCKNIAIEKLKNYPVVWIFKPSEKAVVDVKEELDFVYIDGNHSYEFVKKDIQLYYQLIKADGVIGGHDFTGSFIGVVRAVVEFALKHRFKLEKTFFIRPPDWWIIKK